MILSRLGKVVGAAGMYLFDTDVLTNILKPRPAAQLLERLSHISPKDQFVSVITIAEIVYGAVKSNRPEYHLKNLEEMILRIRLHFMVEKC